MSELNDSIHLILFDNARSLGRVHSSDHLLGLVAWSFSIQWQDGDGHLGLAGLDLSNWRCLKSGFGDWLDAALPVSDLILAATSQDGGGRRWSGLLSIV